MVFGFLIRTWTQRSRLAHRAVWGVHIELDCIVTLTSIWLFEFVLVHAAKE